MINTQGHAAAVCDAVRTAYSAAGHSMRPSARPLVVRPGDERYPTFSPDGSRLLFRGDDDGIAPSGDEEIYAARPDGSPRRRG
jgi:Tol biopolymer transport system component